MFFFRRKGIKLVCYRDCENVKFILEVKLLKQSVALALLNCPPGEQQLTETYKHCASNVPGLPATTADVVFHSCSTHTPLNTLDNLFTRDVLRNLWQMLLITIRFINA